MVGLDVTLQIMKLFVQDVETEEAHFRDCNLLFVLEAIGVGIAAGVLLLLI